MASPASSNVSPASSAGSPAHRSISDWLTQTQEAPAARPPGGGRSAASATWTTAELISTPPFRIAVASLLLALAAAICLIWVRPQGRRTGRPQAGIAQPTILSSIRLNSQCGLQLVQLDRHRIVVGLDRSGIAEVTVIPDTFERYLRGNDAAESEAERLSDSDTASDEPGRRESLAPLARRPLVSDWRDR